METNGEITKPKYLSDYRVIRPPAAVRLHSVAVSCLPTTNYQRGALCQKNLIMNIISYVPGNLLAQWIISATNMWNSLDQWERGDVYLEDSGKNCISLERVGPCLGTVRKVLWLKDKGKDTEGVSNTRVSVTSIRSKAHELTSSSPTSTHLIFFWLWSMQLGHWINVSSSSGILTQIMLSVASVKKLGGQQCPQTYELLI